MLELATDREPYVGRHCLGAGCFPDDKTGRVVGTCCGGGCCREGAGSEPVLGLELEDDEEEEVEEADGGVCGVRVEDEPDEE